ncbi:hypothetical protein GHT06_017903 [Daphnia sinensis]|uniref:Uncharacterized protein n=1 Tax=Daphnia sinensis TaxID=1820382 RepID=A0AAD5PRW2_9CRUS|nr:hypothetical protein GHT06_017903 [Daphnia sinensis]
MTFHADPQTPPCLLHERLPLPVRALCLPPKCIVTGMHARHLVTHSAVSAYFSFKSSFFSHTRSKTIPSLSPFFFLPFTRNDPLALSKCKSLSSICYKVMSPLFRHGRIQIRTIQASLPKPTGRPTGFFLG